mmetsp:Transcript_3879/g.5197  ORF Transcript_3879/g.5197 Transcript_3879/m.5197 type:complete len:203 (-) Transcript_3879:708-1316(-)
MKYGCVLLFTFLVAPTFLATLIVPFSYSSPSSSSSSSSSSPPNFWVPNFVVPPKLVVPASYLIVPLSTIVPIVFPDVIFTVLKPSFPVLFIVPVLDVSDSSDEESSSSSSSESSFAASISFFLYSSIICMHSSTKLAIICFPGAFLTNGWFSKSVADGRCFGSFTKHFATKSLNALDQSPSPSVGGGLFGIRKMALIGWTLL